MTTTLLDIGDLTETLKVGKVEITMRGLSAYEIFGLLVRYPALQAMFDKASQEKDDKKKKPGVSQEDILRVAPQAVYEAVAMCDVNLTQKDGTIQPATLKKAVAVVRRLPISDQLKLINKFFGLTFAEGVGPFVEDFVNLMQKFKDIKEAGEEVVASVTNSQSPSDDAFVLDTPFNRRGVRHLAN